MARPIVWGQQIKRKCRGAYFADVLDKYRVAVKVWTQFPSGWPVWLAHDFGSAAPSMTDVCSGRMAGDYVPDGRWYACGRVIAVDELATNMSDDRLNDVNRWMVPVLVEAIRELCRRCRINASGLADEAIFVRTGSGAGCIADEFQRAGVHFKPAFNAARLSGWQHLRRLAVPCRHARPAGAVREPRLSLLVADSVLCGQGFEAAGRRGQQRRGSCLRCDALRGQPRCMG